MEFGFRVTRRDLQEACLKKSQRPLPWWLALSAFVVLSGLLSYRDYQTFHCMPWLRLVLLAFVFLIAGYQELQHRLRFPPEKWQITEQGVQRTIRSTHLFPWMDIQGFRVTKNLCLLVSAERSDALLILPKRAVADWPALYQQLVAKLGSPLPPCAVPAAADAINSSFRPLPSR